MRSLIFISFLFLHQLVSAQGSFSGRIVSIEDQSPIGGTAISLNGKTILLTDTNGYFKINSLPKGNFALAFTHVSFSTRRMNGFFTGKDTVVTIQMRPLQRQLKEVQVHNKEMIAIKSYPVTPILAISPPAEKALSTADMRSKGAITLTEGLTSIPGVGQMTTGPGIAKPVIRGMYGNRIQTIYCGMRFDNQQWQDEHGLGITDLGISSVKVVMGPSSLEHGSEALGGTIILNDELNANPESTESSYKLKFFSNTLGTNLEYNVRTAYAIKVDKDNPHDYNYIYKAWHLNVMAEAHADYSDGNNNRILNTRFNGMTIRLGNETNNRTKLDYTGSVYNYGFLAENNIYHIVSDDRYSMLTNQPHHTVVFNMLNWRTQWNFHDDDVYDKHKNDTIVFLNDFGWSEKCLLLNVGYVANNRLEAEAGNKISLNMFLNTLNADLKYHSFGSNYGFQTLVQSNTNLGSRVIIPDAWIFENSVFATKEKLKHYFLMKGGLRYDTRKISTLNTLNMNYDDKIKPFSKFWQAGNGSFDINYVKFRSVNFSFSAASGYRTPNLAELSSNGIHEGTFRWEKGNIGMKTENNLGMSFNTGVNFTSPLSLSVTLYRNFIYNYIYLSPSHDSIYSFQIYNYQQSNSILQGGSLNLFIGRYNSKFNFSSTYAYTDARRSDGKYLPFIPANKISSEINYNFKRYGNNQEKNYYLRIAFDYVFAQNHFGDFETSTPAYHLLNAGAGYKIPLKVYTIDFSLSGNNLLNAAYFDNLSRLKQLGYYNIGRNIMFSCIITHTKDKTVPSN